MKIYIASSWKNQHGVEMLTSLLRKKNHEVISWVENNYGENHNHVTKKFPFEEWVESSEADQSFKFDTDGATGCDLLIYYGPSGKDACAEMGAAWAKGIPIFGLYAKGEDLGLMRKMMKAWYSRFDELLTAVERFDFLIKNSEDDEESRIVKMTEHNMNIVGLFIDHLKNEHGIGISDEAFESFFNA